VRARADALVLFGGKLLSNVGQVGLAVVTARDLGPSERGAFVLVMTVVIITTLFSSAGTSTVMRTRLASEGASHLDVFLGLAAVLAVIQVAVTAGIVMCVSWAADLSIGPLELALAAVLGSASLLVWLLIDITFGVGRPRTVAFADSTGSASQLVLYLVAVQFVHPSVEVVLSAVLAGYLLEAGLLARVLPERRLARDEAEWRALMRAGLPSMRQAVAEFASYRMNRIVIGVAGTAAEVGVYSVAATGAELLRLLPLAVGQVLSPRVARGHIEIAHLRSIRILVFAVMGAAAIALSTVGAALIVPILGAEYRDAKQYLPVLAAAEIALALYQIDVFALQGLGRFREAARAAVWCGPAILLVNLVIVPIMGPDGAAIATLVGFITMALIARRTLSGATVT
jgi:O-antigen/teichoic acid export membrane protein